MNPLYPVVAERAVYRCECCHAWEVVFNFPFEVEHILPQAHGGTDALDNLALACHACNLFKSDFETGQDEESRAEVALFHPRRDVWERLLASMKARQSSVSRLLVGPRWCVCR